jgi:hypothetical protein
MQLEQFFDNLIVRLQDLFQRSYGDPDYSDSDDKIIPANTPGFVPVINVSVPSKLTIQNYDPADGTDVGEIMISYSSRASIGFRVPVGKARVIDDFKGTIYARCSDTTKVGYLNYDAAALVTK